MAAEAPRFATQPAPPGPNPIINFMESSLRRDALIERVLSPEPKSPVLEVPVVFDSSVVDIDIPPRPSGADYQHLRTGNRLTGPRARVGAVLLGAGAVLSGLGGVGGAAGQGPTEAPRTQNPSATSTPEFGTPEPTGGAEATPLPTDPITGALITPEPSETPCPTASPVPTPLTAEATHGVSAALVENGNDATGTLDQEAGSSAPPSILPSGDPPLDDDPPDRDLQTALADECDQAEQFPSVNELIDSLISQPLGENSTIRNVSYGNVEKRLLELWNTYSQELGEIAIPDYDGERYTEKFIRDILDLLQKGMSRTNQDYAATERMGFAGGFAVILIATTGDTDNINLKKSLSKIADLVYDYGVSINVFNNLRRSKEFVDDSVVVNSQAVLGYTPQTDRQN